MIAGRNDDAMVAAVHFLRNSFLIHGLLTILLIIDAPEYMGQGILASKRMREDIPSPLEYYILAHILHKPCIGSDEGLLTPNN